MRPGNKTGEVVKHFRAAFSGRPDPIPKAKWPARSRNLERVDEPEIERLQCIRRSASANTFIHRAYKRAVNTQRL